MQSLIHKHTCRVATFIKICPGAKKVNCFLLDPKTIMGKIINPLVHVISRYLQTLLNPKISFYDRVTLSHNKNVRKKE